MPALRTKGGGENWLVSKSNGKSKLRSSRKRPVARNCFAGGNHLVSFFLGKKTPDSP